MFPIGKSFWRIRERFGGCSRVLFRVVEGHDLVLHRAVGIQLPRTIPIQTGSFVLKKRTVRVNSCGTDDRYDEIFRLHGSIDLLFAEIRLHDVYGQSSDDRPCNGNIDREFSGFGHDGSTKRASPNDIGTTVREKLSDRFRYGSRFEGKFDDVDFDRVVHDMKNDRIDPAFTSNSHESKFLEVSNPRQHGEDDRLPTNIDPGISQPSSVGFRQPLLQSHLPPDADRSAFVPSNRSGRFDRLRVVSTGRYDRDFVKSSGMTIGSTESSPVVDP